MRMFRFESEPGQGYYKGLRVSELRALLDLVMGTVEAT